MRPSTPSRTNPTTSYHDRNRIRPSKAGSPDDSTPILRLEPLHYSTQVSTFDNGLGQFQRPNPRMRQHHQRISRQREVANRSIKSRLYLLTCQQWRPIHYSQYFTVRSTHVDSVSFSGPDTSAVVKVQAISNSGACEAELGFIDRFRGRRRKGRRRHDVVDVDRGRTPESRVG